MAASDGNDIKTLLLVGRSGNGKSSIGNSILGQNVFSTKQKSESKVANDTDNNNEFKVIDCSGIGDTGEDMAGSLSDVFNIANEAVVKYGGIQAIVFVLKYGVRYTKQEKDAVRRVKDIFGDDVFKNWVVLAFSYGDNFENDTQETFNEWCRSQTGDIKNLFEEVNYRCVLFNNKVESSHSRLLLTEFIQDVKSISKQTLLSVIPVDHRISVDSSVETNNSDICFYKCCYSLLENIKNICSVCWSPKRNEVHPV